MPGLRIEAESKTPAWLIAGGGAVAGTVLWLAFPPVEAGPLAFLAVGALAWAFTTLRPKQVLIVTSTCFITFFALLLSWIRLFGPEAYIALVLLQAAMTSVPLTIFSSVFSRTRAQWGWLAFPASLVVTEYLRSVFPFQGFAWGSVGYSQVELSPLMGLASYGGVWALTAVVAMSSALAVQAASRRGTASLLMATAALLLIFVGAVLPQRVPQGPEVEVALIQGNAPEGLQDPHADDIDVFSNHLDLTRDLKSGPDLIVWPESSVEGGLLDQGGRQALGEALQQKRAYGLIGAHQDVGQERFENATLFFGPDGMERGRYIKQHLVPFGEYLPYRRVLEPLLSPFVEELSMIARDAVPGTESQVFALPQGQVASVICFESTFPSLVREFVNQGAGLLVVSTNNSSFARTSASAQHVAFSRMRAAEHRMWVMHAALTGISAVVAPDGGVRERTELFEPAVLTASVPMSPFRTTYARWGDWVPTAALITMLVPALSQLMGALRRRVHPKSYGQERPNALVIIPTYQEAENISQIIDAVLAADPALSILVVDDGSPDGTADIVAQRAEADTRINLLRRDHKSGLGRSYIAGFRWGLERGYNRFIEMDADFSHDPAMIPELIAVCDAAGAAVGSRYVSGGGVEGWPKPREWLSRGGNLYSRLLLGIDVMDSTSGFRCYRAETLKDIGLDEVRSEGYGFQIDMTYRALGAGHKVVEVPITFRERRAGSSKMSRRIVFEAIALVTAWGVRDLLVGKRWR